MRRGQIIAPGVRTRHLHASYDVPGRAGDRGWVGGAPSWPTRPLFRRDLAGWLIFCDIAPEMGGTGSSMAESVYVAGGVVERTLPGRILRNQVAQLPILSELSHF